MTGEHSISELHRLLVRVDEELGDHRRETREELQGIRTHLRELNSKTASHEAKISNLNGEVFGRLRQAVVPPELVQLLDSLKGITGDNAPAFTRKDARLVKSTFVAIWVVGAAIFSAIAWVATHVKVVW